MEIKVHLDMTGAMRKTAALRQIPAAFRYNATDWAASTVKYLKRAVSGGGGSFGYFKSTAREIFRNLDFMYQPTGAQSGTITLGTGGFVGKSPVIYARIQEEGGTITAKTHPYLAIPLPGSKGLPRNYPNLFLIESKKGNVLLVERAGRGKIKPRFVLKHSVTLPARHWFSGPIAQRRPLLEAAMSEAGVWATALARADRKAGSAGAK